MLERLAGYGSLAIQDKDTPELLSAIELTIVVVVER